MASSFPEGGTYVRERQRRSRELSHLLREGGSRPVDLPPSRVHIPRPAKASNTQAMQQQLNAHTPTYCGLLSRLPPIDPSASGDSDICHNKAYGRHRFHSLSVAHTERREASHDDNRTRYATAVSWSEVRRGRRRRAALPPESESRNNHDKYYHDHILTYTWYASREEWQLLL